MDRLAEAEQHAAAGEVLLDETAMISLGDRVRGAERSDDPTLGLRVRLALHPEKPCTIGCYVAMGRHMVRRGLLDEVEAELRMFRLLLQSGAELAREQLPPG